MDETKRLQQELMELAAKAVDPESQERYAEAVRQFALHQEREKKEVQAKAAERARARWPKAWTDPNAPPRPTFQERAAKLQSLSTAKPKVTQLAESPAVPAPVDSGFDPIPEQPFKPVKEQATSSLKRLIEQQDAADQGEEKEKIENQWSPQQTVDTPESSEAAPPPAAGGPHNGQSIGGSFSPRREKEGGIRDILRKKRENEWQKSQYWPRAFRAIGSFGVPIANQAANIFERFQDFRESSRAYDGERQSRMGGSSPFMENDQLKSLVDTLKELVGKLSGREEPKPGFDEKGNFTPGGPNMGKTDLSASPHASGTEDKKQSGAGSAIFGAILSRALGPVAAFMGK